MDHVAGYSALSFGRAFLQLTGHEPLPWQRRLYERFCAGQRPRSIDLPTGLGKTSVIAIWWIALNHRAPLPRRLVYVVDRRAVVDQATREAERLVETPLAPSADVPRISTLRGNLADNREWLADPAHPAVVVGTVDMIGSRLLFSGYGVSRAMRPFHAGLLGMDTLLVLDEAHLAGPFEALLRTLEVMTGDNGVKLTTLSATGTNAPDFTLDADDDRHPVVQARVNASKRLAIREPSKPDGKTIAQRAMALCGSAPARVAVFLSSRDLARRVAAEIGRRDKTANVTMLVGARRVHERQTVAEDLAAAGFLDDGEVTQNAYVVATAAGEVGVDLDADHALMDLVPFERIVQRLGRVNRRGRDGHVARVEVSPLIASGKVDPAHEERLRRTLELLSALAADADGTRLASPACLAELKAGNPDLVREASTSPPLHPPLTRPLVDSFAMTSLADHTGRPEVAPWLRGWVEDEPQTTVVWRTHLPVVTPADPAETDIVRSDVVEAFFDVAPIHVSERLETESSRVAKWVLELRKAAAKSGSAPVDRMRTAGLVLSSALEWRRTFTVGQMLGKDGLSRDELARALAGNILVLNAVLAGVAEGLLDASATVRPETADASSTTFPVRFRVERHPAGGDPDHPVGWHVVRRFEAERSAGGETLATLSVLVATGAATNEDSRSQTSAPVTLDDHTTHVRERARTLAGALVECGVLPADEARAIVVAARLHDLGKDVPLWQDAMKAPDEGRPFAKTAGGNGRLLGGYRHEFGSLLVALDEPLDEDTRDLVLHLVAAHHGRARPLLPVDGAEGSPTRMAAVAGEVARRYARLNRRYGPWGLAFREAILRAADQAASRAEAEGRCKAQEPPDGGQ